jgi:quercetin dioxygenase-like cupin family protein
MSKSFARIAQGVNVMPLQTAINRQPQLFGQHGSRASAYGSPHAAMSDIWVRYNDIANLDPANPAAFNDEHDSVWYPAYYALPQIRPILFDLMAYVDGERLGGVLITKTPPGGRIERHVDSGWHASYYDKFYLPIQNDGGATFNFEDGVIVPQLGDAYWFRNDVPHWVENRSERDRIALIVCIKTHRYAP